MRLQKLAQGKKNSGRSQSANFWATEEKITRWSKEDLLEKEPATLKGDLEGSRIQKI